MNVDTKNLRVRPNEDYAETDERVKVRSSNGDRVDGVGAQVWLAEPMRLLLKSNSKAHYATKKP
jgi:lipopolysaccharide export system protein LptC